MNKKNQINIFIVEDNEVFAIALKANIENSFGNKPIKIHSFETGELCMKNFKKEKPQVVILDYYLNSKHPDAADGINILDLIKKENPETSVIMLTTDDSLDIAIKSLKHGASDYVVKTETQFMKINYSLLNLFQLMKEKDNARRYKRAFIALFAWFSLLILLIIAMLIFKK